MITEKRCTICSRLILAKRRATYPHAKTCGKRMCYVDNRRRVHNELTLRIKRRARAAKKELAQRRAETTGHAWAHTAEQVAWADHLERLSRPLTAAERANRAD